MYADGTRWSTKSTSMGIDSVEPGHLRSASSRIRSHFRVRVHALGFLLCLVNASLRWLSGCQHALACDPRMNVRLQQSGFDRRVILHEAGGLFRPNAEYGDAS